MKHLLLFAISILESLVCCAQQNSSADLINIEAQKLEQEVISWRRDIHQHPELGNREVRTAALVAKHLQSLGLEVRTGVGKTGVVGLLQGALPGPVIALRADMDALPVAENNTLPFASKAKALYNGSETFVMHACGHDAHVAILMGAAQILAAQRKTLKGTVKFIFQPAEEGAPSGEEGGAALMIKEGVLQRPNVDVIFGLHMDAKTEAGHIRYRPGGTMASACDMRIVVKGKPSHGANPWTSVDPVVVAAQIINNLQTVVSRNLDITNSAGVVTIGSIHGGNRFNIIPGQVEMLGTVRSLDPKDEKMMYDRIRQVVIKTAEAGGATAAIDLPYEIYNPVLVNNVALARDMLPALHKAAGTANVAVCPPETKAEDFALFAEKIPALYFFLGGRPPATDREDAGPHHTPDFLLDEQGFKTGVAAFVHLVHEYGNRQ